MIDTIRAQTQISDADQRRIGDWVEAQVDRLKKTPEADRGTAAIDFRKEFRTQFENSGNSPAFKEQFVTQTAGSAVAQLGNATLDSVTARAMHKVLLDFNRLEAFPAFVAGLKSKDRGVRLLAASGLAMQRTAIAADKARMDQMVAALKEAGLVESEPAVLDRMYSALSVPAAQAGAVFDPFVSMLEKRLDRRRSGALVVDGAEIRAYEFFRSPGVIAALSQPQKEQLVRAVAGFLQMDTKRYSTQGLSYEETDRLQRLLDGAEDILVTAVGAGKGGDIRGALAAGQTPEQVLQQVHLWIGDSASSQQGALNAPPWNVPVGAP